jgi:hypothetical protein
MSNWKNRTMMMNSGGSVSRPTMTDFFEQGYADLGSEESPSTYYNDNRRSDRNIDDLRRLMQNQYYDKISSGTGIGDIKEQVNKIQNMKRKGRNLKQDLNYGPFSGSLSANGNSISARANVGKGILELLKDKESGNNSASYRRGNYSLSGSESGRKSLDYEDGILYGSAFTGDKKLGDGVKAGMRFRFSKGGPVQGFNTGGRVGTSKVRPPGNIIEEEIIKFDELDRPIFVKPSSKRNRPDDFYNMDLIENLVTTLPRRGINARGPASDKTVADFSSLGILGLGRNTLGGESRDLARYFQANPERYKAVMEKFDGNLNDLTKYLESDKVTAEDAELFGSTNLVEIQKNIAESREGSEDPKKVSTESEDNKTTEENTTPPEQPAKEKTDFQLFADEIAIRDEGSYSPEAERAGQVSSMYGQIAPGQVGGFGVAEARGAAAAEAVQQKIDADNRTIGGALAKKRMELDAAPKYGDFGQIPLGKLGDTNMTGQVYKSKNPGQYNSLFVEGAADAVVGDVYTRTDTINRQLEAMKRIYKSAEEATGGPNRVIAFAESLAGAFGLNPPAGGFTNVSAAVQFLQLELAKELLGEGGKTISDNERKMVSEALGMPGGTTTPAQLRAKISNVINKLESNLEENKRFLRRNSEKHPDIANAIANHNANKKSEKKVISKNAYMGK